MNPGRELDALVAEKVMGQEFISEEFKADGGPIGAVLYPHGPYYRVPNFLLSRAPVPAYSTNISAAWEVVEKLKTDTTIDTPGWFTLQEDSEGWEAGWGDWRPHEGFEFVLSVTAPTAPHAICLAALKACGVDV